MTVALAVLAALVAAQLYFGVEAWMLKYFEWSEPVRQASVRTVHVLIGHLIFATTTAANLLVYQATTASAVQRLAVSTGRLEGAA